MLTKKEKIEFTIDLKSIKERFNLEVEYLSKFIDLSEESSKSIQKTLSDETYEKTIESPDDESFLQDLFENEYRIINSYQYHSQLVLIYGVFESTLTHLCNEIFKKIEPKLSLDMIKGNNIFTTCIDYLHLMCDFNISSIEKYKPKLNNYRLVRNYIAHQNSRFIGFNEKDIEKDKNKFIKLLDLLNKTSFDVDNNCFYIVDNISSKDLIKIISDVMLNIISEIESKTFLVIKKHFAKINDLNSLKKEEIIQF